MRTLHLPCRGGPEPLRFSRHNSKIARNWRGFPPGTEVSQGITFDEPEQRPVMKLGKRYVCEEAGIEIVVTKGGAAEITCVNAKTGETYVLKLKE